VGSFLFLCFGEGHLGIENVSVQVACSLRLNAPHQFTLPLKQKIPSLTGHYGLWDEEGYWAEVNVWSSLTCFGWQIVYIEFGDWGRESMRLEEGHFGLRDCGARRGNWGL
jgi:hypothetical protein